MDGGAVADVRHDIAEVVALEPDHISAYNLTFEEGTAFFTDMKRGRITPLPNDDQSGASPFAPRCTKDLIEEALFDRRATTFCLGTSDSDFAGL